MSRVAYLAPPAGTDSNGLSRLGFYIDWPLAFLSIAILLIGLVMVMSSSIDLVNRNTGDPFFLLRKQIVFALIGLAGMFIIMRIPMHIWYQTGPVLLISALLMLLVVLLPYLGITVNGATRWLNLGLFPLQVSEPVRLCFIIYLAGYLVRRGAELNEKATGFIKPMLLFACTAILILLQPDFGAVVVLFLTIMSLMFIAGARLIQFVLFSLLMFGMMGLLVLVSPYRLQRFLTFMDPWADPFNTGFQLTQALIAFGSGGWSGLGLGGSIQKLFYLPEAYNDFLLAILAEELGAVGVLLILALFIALLLRMFAIANTAVMRDKLFNAYVVYGIGFWFVIQTLISFGVNMGLLPTKGLTLPLMSAGGSSLIVMMIAIAFVMRVACENEAGSQQARRKSVSQGERL